MGMDILSKMEDEWFSGFVAEYNRTDSEHRKGSDWEFIRERTKLLVYRICREKLMITEDLISSIFLNIYEDLDRIIECYRITTRTFNHYIRQVCIYRIRRVRAKEIQPRYIEKEYMRECPAWYTIDDSTLLEPAETEENEPVIFYRPSRFLWMDMPTLVKYIVSNRDRLECRPRNEKERILMDKLSRSYFRRNFLFFILSMPQAECALEAENLARVFQVDDTAFTRFFYLKEEIIRRNYPSRQKNLELAAMHWRLMAKLKNSMYSARNDEEYGILRENYQAHVRCHRNRMNDARRSMRGIVHADIAEALDMSRTTVTMAIRKVKLELERISTAFPI